MQFFDDKNFSWGVLAVESVLIMLSVVLGFMLNSWRVSQTEQANVDTALKSIASEMQYNKLEMEDHLPYYRTMRDTLKHLASTKGWDTAIEMMEIPDFGGYNIPVLRASAFETAQSTGTLSHIEFDLANRLFAYYRFQNLYTDLLDKLTSGFIRNDYKTIDNWHLVFGLMAGNGDYIHDSRFEEVLSQLKEEYNLAEIDVSRTDSTLSK